MIANTNFDVIKYVEVVDSIANGFFNSDGEYAPHIGKMNAIRVFYNECIIDDEYDVPHDFTDALLLNSFVRDRSFIEVFNESIKNNGIICLNFANAYSDAMKIVDAKVNSVNGAATIIKDSISKVIGDITSIFSEDGLTQLQEIINSLTTGEFNPQLISALNTDTTK